MLWRLGLRQNRHFEFRMLAEYAFVSACFSQGFCFCVLANLGSQVILAVSAMSHSIGTIISVTSEANVEQF